MNISYLQFQLLNLAVHRTMNLRRSHQCVDPIALVTPAHFAQDMWRHCTVEDTYHITFLNPDVSKPKAPFGRAEQLSAELDLAHVSREVNGRRTSS